MPSATFTADAAIQASGSGSFTIDAVITPQSFTVDAWIVSDHTWQHHRVRDHFGSESDLYVTLSSTVGKYVALTPVHYVLEDIVARLYQLENYDHVLGNDFTIDATITSNSIFVDAVVQGTQTGTFTIDAVILLGGAFTVDAIIMPSFTIDAFII